MSTVKYTAGQMPTCPECHRELEGPVEDYVIPGKIGPASASEDMCGWCDAEFTVERTGENEYTLTPL